MEVLARISAKEAGLDFWSSCFHFQSLLTSHTLGLIETMLVQTADIWSGRLEISRDFFRDVEAGSVTIIRSSPQPFTFNDALSVLAVIGTYARLARIDGVRMRDGAWIRTRLPHGINGRKRPVMPFTDLERATGLDEITLRAILHPFQRDGAISFVPHLRAGGGAGIVLRDGFIDDGAVARLLID